MIASGSNYTRPYMPSLNSVPASRSYQPLVPQTSFTSQPPTEIATPDKKDHLSSFAKFMIGFVSGSAVWGLLALRKM